MAEDMQQDAIDCATQVRAGSQAKGGQPSLHPSRPLCGRLLGPPRAAGAVTREPPFPMSEFPRKLRVPLPWQVSSARHVARRSMAASDAPSSWKLLRGAVVAREVRVHQ